MGLEDRLLAMEERLAALEKENRELKAAAGVKPAVPPASEWRPRTTAEQMKLVEELTPMQRVEIRTLAMDVTRYGWDVAMEMHGRKVYKRGRKAA